MDSAVQNIYSWDVLSSKRISNDIVIYICDLESLFKWFYLRVYFVPLFEWE